MSSFVLLEGGTDKLLAENGTDFIVLEDHDAGGVVVVKALSALGVG